MVCARGVRSSSGGVGRAAPSFFMALTRPLKSWSNPKLHSDSAFRSLRLTTDKQPSPSSPSHNEIPASVPINVESITGQLHRSTAYIDVQTWTSGTSNSFPVSIALHSPPASISESLCAYTQKNETDRDE